VKLLIDMNLPPSWVDRLSQHGFEAVHWASVGAPSAPDREILAWARDHGHVLLTHDLDFSAILAAASRRSPSVVQLRTHDLLSDEALLRVVSALRDHRERIERGALISIDARAARVRILPL
jgi:predicted nuclease of predicted toxin-antitoxin system